MINQHVHPFDKPDGVGHLGMKLERRFIHSARVNIEQPRIADRATHIQAEAPLFRPRWRRDLRLAAVTRMGAGKNDQLRGCSVRRDA
jgi:hypothetical protein